MASKSRVYLFEEEKISKAIISLSLPTVAANLVSVLYSLADTFFVGMLNNPVQTAAVSLAAPILLAFNAVNNLFGVGSSSMMSRALGENDIKTLHHASSFGFWGAAFCSLIFSLLCFVFVNPLLVMMGASAETLAPTGRYLMWTVMFGAIPSILNVVMAYLVRSEGATLNAAIGTMSGCLLNIILDPFFILPQFMNMGAEGAALATFLSNCFAVLYFLGYLYFKRKSTYVSISLKDFTLNRKIVNGVCAVGIPASIQNLLNVVSQLLFNNLAAAYGTIAVAAVGICMRSANVLIYISQGISQGVMPLIGYNWGAKNYDRLKQAFWYALKLSFGTLLCLSMLYELFPGTIMHFFIDNAKTVDIGSVLLRGMALSMPFLAADFMSVGVFQSVGKGSYSLVLAILRKIVFEIPFMFLFNLIFGLYGLGFSQLTAEILMSIIGLTMLLRFLKKSEEKLKAAHQ